GHSTLKTWLFSLAKNKLKKYYRTKQYHIQLQEKLKSDYREIYQTTEDIIISQENARIIYHYIQQLDGIKKEIAILRIYGELSFKEIATLIQKNESYVRVVFYRIKLQMVKEMGEEQ